MQKQKIAILGYGSIGKEIIKSCRLIPSGPQIETVIARPAACKETARDLGSDIQVLSELPEEINYLSECAAHNKVKTTVLNAVRLRRRNRNHFLWRSL